MRNRIRSQQLSELPIQPAADGCEGQRWPVLELVERGAWNQRFRARLSDGAAVECVLYRDDTLCVSSQVGCAVRCPFCASGAEGLSRQLTLGELIGQVEAVRARGVQLARVTVSGVGEPLHNHPSTLQFLDYCRRERLGMSLTTSGGPLPRLREWLHAPHNGLTISVHAGSSELRSRSVPHGPALEPLFELLESEVPRLTQRRKRKTALAYLLVGGLNDADEELEAFGARARALGLRVHLYAYNAGAHSPYQRVSRERYQQAYDRLRGAGLYVSMSSQARIEANGGCGTLIALRRAGPDTGP